MAELADAHGSGPCTRKGVGVRVPPSAPTKFDPSCNEQLARGIFALARFFSLCPQQSAKVSVLTRDASCTAVVNSPLAGGELLPCLLSVFYAALEASRCLDRVRRTVNFADGFCTVHSPKTTIRFPCNSNIPAKSDLLRNTLAPYQVLY